MKAIKLLRDRLRGLRPISTAPKDGTKMVGIKMKNGKIVDSSPIHWGDSSNIYDPVFGRFNKREWWINDGGGADWFDPTHWCVKESK